MFKLRDKNRQSTHGRSKRILQALVVACLLVSTNSPGRAENALDYLKKSENWFGSSNGQERISNLLSHQDKNGSWPKNLETTERPYRGDREKLKGTFDNSATVNELRLLARAYRATGEDNYKESFLDGVHCILESQYKNGGWPQRPDPSGYAQHITFNDGTMIGLMTLLREIFSTDNYDFVPQKIRRQASEAFARGVQCILDCQIRVNGQLTAWCAQHDRKSLKPQGARSYEHPSISGGESAGIVCLLMSLEDPTVEIQRSINGAVAWYERSKLTGIRFEKKNDDRKIVSDSDAPTLWARFYDIKTNRPIFSGRDGVIKYNVSEIESERRNGYSWYVRSGTNVQVCWSKWKWKRK